MYFEPFMNGNLFNINRGMRLMRIEKIIRIAVLTSAVGIAPAASAQPNVFLIVDLVQDGGPSAVQSSVAYSRKVGASYSDTSVSASASKSASASSEKESSGYSYSASSAAAASNRRGSAAARASARGAGASSYKSSSAASQSSASTAKADVQYEQHDNVSYGQTVYAQTGGDGGFPASEALSTLASSLLQYQVDVTYPEMMLAEFFNDDQPSSDVVRKSPKYVQILASLADQQVGFVLAAKLSIRGIGGVVSNYSCRGSLTASLSKTKGALTAANYSVSGDARGENLENCQRILVGQLSDTLAAKVIPALGN